MKKAILLLVIAIFIDQQVGAEVPYHVAVGGGEGATCKTLWQKDLERVERFFLAEFRLKLVRRGRVVRVPEYLTNLENRGERYWDYATKLNLIPEEPTILFAAPIKAFHRWWKGGMAVVGSYKIGGPAIIWTTGGDATALITAHELGHVFGLGHRGNCNWMDIHATSCRRVRWGVTNVQRRIIEATIGRDL